MRRSYDSCFIQSVFLPVCGTWRCGLFQRFLRLADISFMAGKRA